VPTSTSRVLSRTLMAALFTAAPAAMAVTAQSSYLVTEPGVELEGADIYGIQNGSAYSVGAPLTLSTDASVSESLFGGLGVVQSNAQGSATTTSAASGSVGFRTSFQIAVLRPEVQSYLPVGYSFNSSWQYQFTPTTDARVTVDYDVDAGVLLGPAFGGWNIALMTGSSIGAPSVVNGSGSFATDLIAGQVYTLEFFSPDFTTFDQAVLAAGTETADFRWNIAEAVTSPAPEPTTWMLTAVGLLALLSRRRRSETTGA
jgi:MYXO-CTERM domain-containing protein